MVKVAFYSLCCYATHPILGTSRHESIYRIMSSGQALQLCKPCNLGLFFLCAARLLKNSELPPLVETSQSRPHWMNLLLPWEGRPTSRRSLSRLVLLSCFLKRVSRLTQQMQHWAGLNSCVCFSRKFVLPNCVIDKLSLVAAKPPFFFCMLLRPMSPKYAT